MHFLLQRISYARIQLNIWVKSKHRQQRWKMSMSSIPDLIQQTSFWLSAQLRWGLTTYSTLGETLDAVTRVPYEAGATHTAEALAYVTNHILTPAGGDRDGYKNVVVVITDGLSFDPAATKLQATALLSAHDNVIAIGIRNGIFYWRFINIVQLITVNWKLRSSVNSITINVANILISESCSQCSCTILYPGLDDLSELDTIATDANHVLRVQGYSGLAGVQEALLNLVCNGWH